MNKQCYRLIFSQVRGMLVAVAEIVKSEGKAPGEGRAPRKHSVSSDLSATLASRLTAVAYGVATVLGSAFVAPVSGYSQTIAADPNAPANQRPTIGTTQNGVPLVNIQAPSKAGVSRNTYRQFDVQEQGAILNNSTRNVQQTELGGMIRGNANLKGRNARVILNEVNSPDASQLRGAIEVAGQRAQVVIANPSGVSCDGCGFINVTRGTLTTGTAIVNDGDLQGFEVRGGTVRIDGAGFDASRTDYAEIIARAAEVNANIFANELNITTGANRVAADGNVTPIEGAGQAPQVAIDVSQLGGMYAGKITLVGTEAGVGVRNAGNLGASAGEVVLTLEGRLVNAGNITANGEIRVDARSGIENEGMLYAQSNTQLLTLGDIDNSGVIASGGDTTLSANGLASRILNRASALAAAGVQANGEIGSTGALTLTAGNAIVSAGETLAGAEQRLTARDIDLRGARANAQGLTVNASGAVRTDDAQLTGNHVELKAQTLSNVRGQIAQLGEGRLGLAILGAFDNQDGLVVGDGAVRVDAGSIANRGGAIGSQQSTVTLTSGAFDNTGGSVQSKAALDVRSGDLDNSAGTLLSGGPLQLQANAFDNRQGLVVSGGALDARATSLDNGAGVIEAREGLGLSIAERLINAEGVLQAQGPLRLRSADLTNADGLVSGGEIDLDIGEQRLDNTRGQIVATGANDTKGTLAIRSGTLVNAAGRLQSQGALTLASGDLDNTAGTVVSGGALQLQAKGLDNTQGLVASSGALDARATSLDNSAGVIEAREGLGLSIAERLINAEGVLQAQGPLRLSAAGLTNTNGTVSGGQIDLDAGAELLDNTRGRIAATGALTIGSGTLVNTAGLIQSQGPLRIDTRGQALVNTDSGVSGGILSQGFLALTTGDLTNSSGYIGANGPLRLQAKAIDNRGGTLTSGETLETDGSSLDNRGGVVQANGDVRLALSGALDNTGSAIRAGGTLSATAESITNANTLGAGQGLQGTNVTLDARTIDNTTGAMRANETLTAKASGGSAPFAFTNTGGTLLAGQSLTIEGQSLSSDGQLLSLGDLAIVLERDYVHRGELLADGTVRIELRGRLLNQASLQGGEGLVVKAASIENTTSGELSSGGKTELTASDTLTNRGLIDGRETVVRANTLTNLGRIYGDTVGIGAGTLSNVGGNGPAPVIAARENLQLGASTIDNREQGLIFSAGDLAIGGVLDANGNAVGRAERLNNASATIEALGEGRIAARLIGNTNEHFSTEEVVVGQERVREYQAKGKTERQAVVEGAPIASNKIADFILRHKEYDYTRTTTETQVASSAPGQILTGGNLTFAAEAVNNDKSQIVAGGVITVEGATVTNTDALGERRVSEQGTVSKRKGLFSKRKITEAYSTPDRVEAITLGAMVYRENAAPQGTGTQIAARSTNAIGENVVTEIAALDRPDTVVRSVEVVPTLPNSQLFTVASSGEVLIQTDARFGAASPVNTREILRNVTVDASRTQTRLGDAFIEQRLIREQVVSLTGQRFLPGFGNDEQQYAELLARGAAFAQTQGVRLGEGLTAEQMAQLTDDVVLLVEQDVTLPDGSTTQALVPKVYARTSSDAARPSPALIAGDAVRLNLSGDLFNTGTLTARNYVEVVAENVNPVAGRIQANAVALTARNDINHVTGGRIAAEEYLQVAAGRDLNIASTTTSVTDKRKQFSLTTTIAETRLDKVGSLEVTGDNGTLIATAGRDANLTAAAIVNRGNGGTLIAAGNDVNFNTLTESSSRESKAKNYHRRDAESHEVGTQIQSIGDLIVQAGRDVNARAVDLTSSDGLLQVRADRDVSLEAGEATSDFYLKTVKKKKKALSRKTTTRIDSVSTTTAQGSSLSGATAEVIAGQDIQLTGSSVVSDAGTLLSAGRDVTLEAAIETRKEVHFKHVKKSGVFSGGTFAFTIGQQKQSQDQKGVSTAAAASTVGSTLGDVLIRAGQNYTQIGSDLLTPAGSPEVQAQRILVKEARATSRVDTETKFQQAGLTVGLTGGVVAAIETAQQLKAASENTSDGRLKTLAVATSALSVQNSLDAAEINEQSGGKQGTPGVSIGISIGASKSSSKSTQTSDNAVGSRIVAARDGRFVATGAGASSDLTIQGSTVQLGGKGELASEGTLNLLAAQNTATLKSTNKSAGGSVGISIGSTTGITVAASVGRGKANGEDETYTNTHIEAGDGLVLQSGGDVTLKGAVITTDQVSGTIGGNLTVESLQDKSTYDSKQMTAGVSFTYGFSTGGSVSGNFSQSKIDSDYLSVTEQSGIRAGDGGFQLTVAGHTDLKGGAITSTQAAMDAGKNYLSTATLATSDVENYAEYSASSVGVSGGYGGGGFSASPSLPLSASGDDASTTRSAVSGGAIVIRDEAGQLRLTGISIDEAMAKLDHEAVTGKDVTNSLKPIFDQREIEAGFAIIGTFGREVGTFRANQATKADLKTAKAKDNERRADDLNLSLSEGERTRLREEAIALRNEAKAINENWGPGGTYSTLTTALVGAVSGNVGAGGSQIIQSVAANYLQSLGAREIKKIADSLSEDTTLGTESARAALQGIVGCAGASAQGASCASGALGASAAVVFNNLLDQASGKSGATLTASEKQAREALVVSLITGIAVATGMEGSEIAMASTAATIETENNSLLRAAKITLKVTKQALKSYQKYGKVSVSDLKKVLKDEGLSIADNLLTLSDGMLTVDDALAIIDLVVGSEFNKANKGKSLEKIAEIEKKYFRGKTTGATKNSNGADASTELGREATNRASFAEYKDELRAAMERPTVSDSYLDEIIGELYRPNAKIGSGSTAAAVREELATGGSVGGKTHSQKSRDYIVALEKWLERNPQASPGDKAAAENIILDMRNALGGK